MNAIETHRGYDHDFTEQGDITEADPQSGISKSYETRVCTLGCGEEQTLELEELYAD